MASTKQKVKRIDLTANGFAGQVNIGTVHWFHDQNERAMSDYKIRKDDCDVAEWMRDGWSVGYPIECFVLDAVEHNAAMSQRNAVVEQLRQNDRDVAADLLAAQPDADLGGIFGHRRSWRLIQYTLAEWYVDEEAKHDPATYQLPVVVHSFDDLTSAERKQAIMEIRARENFQQHGLSLTDRAKFRLASNIIEVCIATGSKAQSVCRSRMGATDGIKWYYLATMARKYPSLNIEDRMALARPQGDDAFKYSGKGTFLPTSRVRHVDLQRLHKGEWKAPGEADGDPVRVLPYTAGGVEEFFKLKIIGASNQPAIRSKSDWVAWGAPAIADGFCDQLVKAVINNDVEFFARLSQCDDVLKAAIA